MPTPWGIYFQDSATPLPKWSGKSLMGNKLPSAGEILKPRVPSRIWKYIGGWTNHLCVVISLRIIERAIDNHGSKSVICETITVKEQRVNGSWEVILRNKILHTDYKSETFISNYYSLRYTLMGFERNYQIKIPSNQLITKNYFLL